MKKRMTIAGVILLVLALGAFGTWAAFNAVGRATNVITTGTIKMELTEEGGSDAEPIKTTDGTKTIGLKYENVMPGDTKIKKPIIKNVGTGDFYTRVKVDIAIEPAADKSEKVLDPSVVIVNYDTENWALGKDGCYYYTGTLSTNDTASPFENVTFAAKEMNDDYQGCTVTMTIQAQAVQVAHQVIGTDKQRDDAGNETDRIISGVMDVQGWPDWDLDAPDEEFPQT